ncbi:trimeric LpxA-like protein [Nadsonia fulvescens var. elongata DSM 6958]|uniref:Acetyltransferase n=1 Tax=Nadsonia fulvescens var. elongata DSM 6958 TaxID=857566 RepID=A0A1E3PL68_9ASCO|nr:trimeric LpxA-like protein [Nadsonia fulvescens var. elongata DSM 6958]
MSGEQNATEKDQNLIDFAYANLNHIPKGDNYEKMISGMLYDSMSQDLVLKRVIKHEEAMEYSNIKLGDYKGNLEEHSAARRKQLDAIFGKIEGEKIFIEPPFYVDYGFNISFGTNFYSNFNLTLLDCSIIKIGNDVLFGPNVTLSTATHPTDPTLRRQGVEFAKPIEIGDNVWLGSNVVVLPGVTIGNGSVIGSGSVVTKSVPENCVVVGIPGKVIRQLKPEDNKAEHL